MKLAVVLLWAVMAAALPTVDETSYPKLIAANKGSVLLVDFWATWCQPCRKEMPELVRLEAKLKSRGFRLVTISADDPEKEAAVKAFLEQIKSTGPAYFKRAKDDDSFINSIDPKWSGALPALFLYDRSGKKLKSFVGESPIAEIESAILKAL